MNIQGRMTRIDNKPFQETEVKFEQTSCGICLSNFSNEDLISRIQECSHVFHKDCLESNTNTAKTNSRESTCPTCRQVYRISPESEKYLKLKERLDELYDKLEELIKHSEINGSDETNDFVQGFLQIPYFTNNLHTRMIKSLKALPDAESRQNQLNRTCKPLLNIFLERAKTSTDPEVRAIERQYTSTQKCKLYAKVGKVAMAVAVPVAIIFNWAVRNWEV